LYHHLAILARPNALQQLFYYAKSLCVPIPFPSAKDSIMTLFDPILVEDSRQSARLTPVDAAFTRVHAILFSGKAWDKLEPSKEDFLSLLDPHIGRSSKKWLEAGYYIANSGFCALQEYGKDTNFINKAIRPIRSEETDVPMAEGVPEVTAAPSKEFAAALDLTKRTHDIVLRRFGDNNVLSYLHVSLAFMRHMADKPNLYVHLRDSFPWKLSSLMLNTLVAPLLAAKASFSRIESAVFPGGSGSAAGKGVDKSTSKNAANRPLPEDFAMRGMPWADSYIPAEWFSNLRIDDDEKFFEVASMTGERKERVLWLGHKIALHRTTLTYDSESHLFGVVPEYDIKIEGLPTPGEFATETDEDIMSVTEPDTQPSQTPSFVEGFDEDVERTENDTAAASPPTVVQ
jgi:hypothetical protein